MQSKNLYSNNVTKSKKRRNNLLYDALTYNGSFTNETIINFTNFDSESYQTVTVKKPESLKLVEGKVNWVHVSGLSNVAAVTGICSRFGLQLPLVQDILNAGHMAKFEETNNGLFTVLDAYSYNEDFELVREHQSFMLGSEFILSFEEGTGHRFEQVRKALDDKMGQIRHQKADYLFNLLISIVVDSYFEVIEIQQDKLMELEDSLMEFNAVHKETGQQIQMFRKDYSSFKKAILPLRESFGRYVLMESGLISEGVRLYYMDTYDHLQQVSLMLESNRETIASLVDLYLANNDLRMNLIMKQLTVIATIFIPLTFLVGVWGMNFKSMPELGLAHGYLFAWLLMIIIGVVLYFWFRRKNLF
jgi:magnesium transporter